MLSRIVFSADEMYDEIYDEKFRVEVFHTGEVVWFPGGKLVTTCDLDVTFFPFDDQICSLELVNWAYNIKQVLKVTVILLGRGSGNFWCLSNLIYDINHGLDSVSC